MIRIDCFTRDGCDACKIAIKNITDATNEVNCDITLNIRNTSLDDILRKEITKFHFICFIISVIVSRSFSILFSSSLGLFFVYYRMSLPFLYIFFF